MGNTGYNFEKQTSFNDMLEYFDRTIALVHEYRGRPDGVTERYARPAFHFIEESFERKPITTLYCIVLVLCASIPIAISLVTFIGSIIIIAASTLTFMCLATVMAGFVCLSPLVPTLLITVAVATLITLSIAALFSMLRLGILLHRAGMHGAIQWSSEMQSYFFGYKQAVTSPSDSHTSLSSVKSDGSLILVNDHVAKAPLVDNEADRKPDA